MKPKALWVGWNHNRLMPAESSWTCWKEEVWNISMVREAGDWRRLPTSGFQMKQEIGSTDSNFLLPKWLTWKLVQGLPSILTRRDGGVSHCWKGPLVRTPGRIGLKATSACGSNLGNVSSRPLPAPLGRCLNVRLPRWEDRLSLSPRRGPSSATREGDWFPTSHSRTLEQTCATVVLWFVGRNTRVLPSYGTKNRVNSDTVVKTLIFTNDFHVAEKTMYSLHRETVEKHKVRMSPC